MTLEAKMDKLIALQEETNKLLVALGGTPSGKATSTKKEDDEEKPAPKKRGPKPKAQKTPTVAAMKKAAVDFLEQAGEDEDEYVERKTYVKNVMAEYGANKFSEIEAPDRLDALAALEDYSSDGDGQEKDDDDIA